MEPEEISTSSKEETIRVEFTATSKQLISLISQFTSISIPLNFTGKTQLYYKLLKILFLSFYLKVQILLYSQLHSVLF